MYPSRDGLLFSKAVMLEETLAATPLYEWLERSGSEFALLAAASKSRNRSLSKDGKPRPDLLWTPG